LVYPSLTGCSSIFINPLLLLHYYFVDFNLQSSNVKKEKKDKEIEVFSKYSFYNFDIKVLYQSFWSCNLLLLAIDVIADGITLCPGIV